MDWYISPVGVRTGLWAFLGGRSHKRSLAREQMLRIWNSTLAQTAMKPKCVLWEPGKRQDIRAASEKLSDQVTYLPNVRLWFSITGHPSSECSTNVSWQSNAKAKAEPSIESESDCHDRWAPVPILGNVSVNPFYPNVLWIPQLFWNGIHSPLLCNQIRLRQLNLHFKLSKCSWHPF